MCKPSRFNRRTFVASAAGAVVIGTPVFAITRRTTCRLEDLTVGDFVERLGARFVIQGESQTPVTAELVEAKASRYAPRPGFRQPFAIVLGLPPHVELDQDVYEVTHKELGPMRLLLTPIGPPTNDRRVEVVFG